MTALLAAAGELVVEIAAVVRVAIDSKREEAIQAATEVMVDALAGLKAMRTSVVSDVADAFADAQAEIDKKEGT